MKPVKTSGRDIGPNGLKAFILLSAWTYLTMAIIVQLIYKTYIVQSVCTMLYLMEQGMSLVKCYLYCDIKKNHKKALTSSYISSLGDNIYPQKMSQ